MKHLPYLLLFLFITSCASKVDETKARTMVESLLNDLKNENYNDVEKYYSALSNESEPLEQKIDKFKRLKDTMGPMQSFEFISSKENYDSDKGINELELKYKVMCRKIIVVETFLVVNDEGKERIIFMNIENAK